ASAVHELIRHAVGTRRAELVLKGGRGGQEARLAAAVGINRVGDEGRRTDIERPARLIELKLVHRQRNGLYRPACREIRHAGLEIRFVAQRGKDIGAPYATAERNFRRKAVFSE